MKTPRLTLVVGFVVTLAMLGNCSSRHPYSQAGDLLRDAAEDYGHVASALSSLGGTLSVGGNQSEQLTGLVSSLLSLNLTAKQIADVRLKYLAAGDAVRLSADEHSALLSAVGEALKQADGFVNNPELQKAIPPSTRPLLEDADRKVKKAYDLVKGAPHG
jgi:hypothetical protein